MKQWWRERFVDNPLLAREIGLREGRGWWRSRVAVVVALMFVAEGHQLTHLAILWHRWGDLTLSQLSSFSSPAWLTLAWSVVACLIILVPLWFLAKSWSRERSTPLREELTLTSITATQLIAARTLLWTLVLSGTIAFDLLIGLASGLAALCTAPEDAALHMWGSSMLSFAPRRALMAALNALFLAGLMTRLSLRGWPAVTVFSVVGLGSLVLGWLVACGPGLLLSGMRPSQVVWVFRGARAAQWVVNGVGAAFVWWGLRRRVAQVYGMTLR